MNENAAGIIMSNADLNRVTIYKFKRLKYSGWI